MNYPYANGTIKSLETKVNDRSKLYVLSKYDKNEFCKVLLAMNYGQNSLTVEDAINSEMLKVKETINNITPNKDASNLFYLINDAQNIKILYKMKNFNLDKKEFLQDNGGINNLSLEKAILEEDYSLLSKKETALIKKLNLQLKEINNPKDLSIIVDEEIYSFAMKNADNVMKHYLQIKIDITNVISFLRSKNLNWAYEEYQKMFINGGKIDIEVFRSIYNEEKNIVIKAFTDFYEEKICKVLLKTYDHFDNVEVSFDKFLLEEMTLYKDDAFNIGPMIYYYLLKQAEAQNIRILYSKANVELKDLI